ncbi:alpha/beta fold hydrolase [Streptomyces wedmorensis]|uniref:alpha/beta fold hydrolase n=1 Tax=Streptomyces wedmorensis TaxID=43759 RepID=UPI0036B5D0AD
MSGYGAAADDWALQWGALREVGCRVVSLDRRWAGSSGRPPYGLRMSRGGEDVRELITHLGLEDVLLVGQSMGASHIWASEHARATAGLSPLTCAAVVAGAGHAAHLDEPAAVNEC